MEDFSDYGIDVSAGSGNRKVKCPKCQTERRFHTSDKPLSVDRSRGLWKCHHCGWSGIVKGPRYEVWQNRPLRQTKEYKVCKFVPQEVTPEEVPDAFTQYMTERKISAQTAARLNITFTRAFMPQIGKETTCLAFPFYRNGQIVNVKYRDRRKHFRLETDCEPIFYGLDDIKKGEPVVIVEGEFDKLTLDECGIKGAISVPNGTGSALDAALSSAELFFEDVPRFILAGDADEPGKRLMRELSSRLGPERCWIADWPIDCKDANQTLVCYGPEQVRSCIDSARAVPIAGAYEINGLKESIWDLYEVGIPAGITPGWEGMNQLYRPRLGECTYITGIPGMGKSAFMAALAVNLAEQHGWKFMAYPAEALPLEQYAASLISIWSGYAFDGEERMSIEMLDEGMAWLDDHFVLVNPEDEDRTVEGLLKLARQQIYRRGIKGVIIDPWNELNHEPPDGMSETLYINRKLGEIRHFARKYQVHIWIVAHPTKQTRTDGEYFAPDLYQISGSAAWFNKADCGITIHRNKNDDFAPATVYITKVRFKHGGRLGKCELYFDRATGRYTEAPPVRRVVDYRRFSADEKDVAEA